MLPKPLKVPVSCTVMGVPSVPLLLTTSIVFEGELKLPCTTYNVPSGIGHGAVVRAQRNQRRGQTRGVGLVRNPGSREARRHVRRLDGNGGGSEAASQPQRCTAASRENSAVSFHHFGPFPGNGCGQSMRVSMSPLARVHKGASPAGDTEASTK